MNVFEKLPWGKLRELAALALATWDEPRSGLPKLQEECGEVIAAVNQFRYGRLTKQGLAEELADNLLMLVQATILVGEDVLEAAIAAKADRLERRLETDRAAGVCVDLRGHAVGCPAHNLRPCACVVGLKRELGQALRVAAETIEAHGARPSEAWLEETFRDFREEMPVAEWRRRLYDRCVGHYLQHKL